jgi:hypothetical protein
VLEEENKMAAKIDYLTCRKRLKKKQANK